MPPFSSPVLLLAQDAASGLGNFVPMILMFAVIWFLLFAPMRKQEKQRRQRLEKLQKGDAVVLGGGILGKVSNLDDPQVALVEIAPNVKVRVLKKDISDLHEPTAAKSGEAKAGESKAGESKAAESKAAESKAKEAKPDKPAVTDKETKAD